LEPLEEIHTCKGGAENVIQPLEDKIRERIVPGIGVAGEVWSGECRIMPR